MTTFKDLQHGTVNPFQPNTKAISYSLDKTLEQGVHTIDLITNGTYTLGLWLDDKYVGMFCDGSLTFELANDVYVEDVIIKEYNELGEIEFVKLGSGSDVTEWTPAWEDLPLEDKPVSFIETSGGTNLIKYYQHVVSPSVEGVGYQFGGKFKNNGDSNLVIRSGVNASNDIDVYETIELNGVVIGNGTHNLSYQFRTQNISDSLSFYAYQPAVYEVSEEIIGGTLTNEGNVYSRPVIRLVKQSQLKGDITINNVRFLYEFKDGDTYLEIDGETQSITDEAGANRNRSILIGYDFPILLPGENTIKVNSGDAIIKVRRKDRWK